MAFTEYETEQIRKALLQETRRCAVTLGMRKTSVEQLTQAVGISKGSFYRFYVSKEMLFFAVSYNSVWIPSNTAKNSISLDT